MKLWVNYLIIFKEIKMSRLFDESFCTSDYDQEMIYFISKNLRGVKIETEAFKGYLKYGYTLNTFWTSPSAYHCEILTKQQFKDKIGMVDKVEDKDDMVSYKLIDKVGFLKASAANSSILNELNFSAFTGKMTKYGSLMDEYGNDLIMPDEFQFFEKVDNTTLAEPITEPVAEPDDELKMLPYQGLIDDCKELNINLVVTDEGLHILDCINSVEYKIEEPDDYQKIVDAIRLLQNKEMN